MPVGLGCDAVIDKQDIQNQVHLAVSIEKRAFCNPIIRPIFRVSAMVDLLQIASKSVDIPVVGAGQVAHMRKIRDLQIIFNLLLK